MHRKPLHLVSQHHFPWQKQVLDILDDETLISAPLKKGDRYIISSTPTTTSDWANYPNFITYFNGHVFEYIEPEEGWFTYVYREKCLFYFNGEEWVSCCCNAAPAPEPEPEPDPVPYPDQSSLTVEKFDGFKYALPSGFGFGNISAEGDITFKILPDHGDQLNPPANIGYNFINGGADMIIEPQANVVFARAFKVNSNRMKMKITADGTTVNNDLLNNIKLEINIPGKLDWTEIKGNVTSTTITTAELDNNLVVEYDGGVWNIRFAKDKTPKNNNGWFYTRITFTTPVKLDELSFTAVNDPAPKPVITFPNKSTLTEEFFDGYKYALPLDFNTDVMPTSENDILNPKGKDTPPSDNYPDIIQGGGDDKWQISPKAGQQYLRAFKLAAGSINMSITSADGSTVSKSWISPLGTGKNISVEIKIPGKTEWMVLHTTASAAPLFSSSSAPWNDPNLITPAGSNCCTGFGGGAWGMSFAPGHNPVPEGWFFVRITFNDTTRQITTINMSA